MQLSRDCQLNVIPLPFNQYQQFWLFMPGREFSTNTPDLTATQLTDYRRAVSGSILTGFDR